MVINFYVVIINQWGCERTKINKTKSETIKIDRCTNGADQKKYVLLTLCFGRAVFQKDNCLFQFANS